MELPGAEPIPELEYETAAQFLLGTSGRLSNPLDSLETLSGDLPSTAASAQMSAYLFAVCGQTTSALQAIAAAIEMGTPAELLREEPEFETLRGHPGFKRLKGSDG